MLLVPVCTGFVWWSLCGFYYCYCCFCCYFWGRITRLVIFWLLSMLLLLLMLLSSPRTNVHLIVFGRSLDHTEIQYRPYQYQISTFVCWFISIPYALISRYTHREYKFHFRLAVDISTNDGEIERLRTCWTWSVYSILRINLTIKASVYCLLYLLCSFNVRASLSLSTHPHTTLSLSLSFQSRLFVFLFFFEFRLLSTNTRKRRGKAGYTTYPSYNRI